MTSVLILAADMKPRVQANWIIGTFLLVSLICGMLAELAFEVALCAVILNFHAMLIG